MIPTGTIGSFDVNSIQFKIQHIYIKERCSKYCRFGPYINESYKGALGPKWVHQHSGDYHLIWVAIRLRRTEDLHVLHMNVNVIRFWAHNNRSKVPMRRRWDFRKSGLPPRIPQPRPHTHPHPHPHPPHSPPFRRLPCIIHWIHLHNMSFVRVEHRTFILRNGH